MLAVVGLACRLAAAPEAQAWSQWRRDFDAARSERSSDADEWSSASIAPSQCLARRTLTFRLEQGERFRQTGEGVELRLDPALASASSFYSAAELGDGAALRSEAAIKLDGETAVAGAYALPTADISPATYGVTEAQVLESVAQREISDNTSLSVQAVAASGEGIGPAWGYSVMGIWRLSGDVVLRAAYMDAPEIYGDALADANSLSLRSAHDLSEGLIPHANVSPEDRPWLSRIELSLDLAIRL